MQSGPPAKRVVLTDFINSLISIPASDQTDNYLSGAIQYINVISFNIVKNLRTGHYTYLYYRRMTG